MTEMKAAGGCRPKGALRIHEYRFGKDYCFRVLGDLSSLRCQIQTTAGQLQPVVKEVPGILTIH